MAAPPEDGLLRDDSGARCWWCGSDPQYVAYHDDEWGRPVTDDTRLYEKLCLEGFQSGLSWLTILRKRKAFREAFAGFELSQVAKFGEVDVARLLGNAGIVRHRGKIEASIHNAGRMIDIQREFGSLATYFWGFVPPASERPQTVDFGAVGQLAKTPTSTRLAKDLKKRGVKFIGPTTAYAFMQAMGIVNDHLEGCRVRDEVEAARQKVLKTLR